MCILYNFVWLNDLDVYMLKRGKIEEVINTNVDAMVILFQFQMVIHFIRQEVFCVDVGQSGNRKHTLSHAVRKTVFGISD